MQVLVKGLTLRTFFLMIVMFIFARGAPPATAQCTHGDPDGSGSVDLSDYAAFVNCETGSVGGSLSPNCGSVDLDADGDVDLLDYARFQRIFGRMHSLICGNPVYGAGDDPVSVAVGDFDGDDDLDLAVSNYESDNVSVLLSGGIP